MSTTETTGANGPSLDDASGLDIAAMLAEQASPSTKQAVAASPAVSTHDPSRSTFDKAKWKLRAELLAEMKERSAALQKNILQQKGTRYAGLKVSLTPQVTIRSSPESSRVYQAIIDRILTPQGASETQTAIRAAVQQQFPGQVVPKDWTKPLPLWAIKKLQVRILCTAPPLNTLQLRQGLTLAELRKLAKAAMERHNEGATTYRATVTVSADTVLINGEPFSITVNKTAGKAYPMVRIALPTLLAALQKAK